MKKNFTLLIFALLFFFGKEIYAQQPPCNADFIINVSGLTVNFMPAMPGDSLLSTHSWSFGDGGNSQAAYPIHTYAAAGNYTVTHIFSRVGNGVVICRDTTVMQLTLQSNTACNIQAGFIFHRDSLNVNTIHFTNTSLNASATDTLSWTFGDGTAAGNIPNPVHSYNAPGTYQVCLKVTRLTPPGTPACSATICLPVVITDPATPQCNLQPFFTIHRDTINNRTFYFANATANLANTDSIRWTFGDGSASAQTNPAHTYANPGIYNVCLRVQRNMPAGTAPCVREFCLALVVADSNNAVCNIQPSFVFSRDSVNRRKIYFNNTTVNIAATDSVRWTFGDGGTSLQFNPVHTYANAGNYQVCLRVKRNMPAGAAPCVREFCLPVAITDSNNVSCNMQPSFVFRRDSADYRKFYFTNTSINLANTDSVRWTFGDGSSSSQINPVHTYANAGTYIVCLRVQRTVPAGTPACVREFCISITVLAPNTCNLQANYTSRRDSSNWRTIHFTNTSIGLQPSDSVRWTFGDGSSAVSTNATHTYTAVGWYNVCLRVKRNTPAGTAPCVREICRLVRVDSVNSSNCNYLVDFMAQRDTSNNLNVFFNNISLQQPGATASWRFGDGTSAVGWNSNHTYAAPGVYYVCLRVQYANGCVRERCRVIQIANVNNCLLQPYPNPATTQVSVSVNLQQPLVIYSRIYNSMNMIVRQQQQNGATGFNTVTFAGIGNLPPGIYRIVVNYGQRECRGSFIKY
ncbi:MAG: PKD domain-containing protein [Ferruginibacter sp.]